MTTLNTGSETWAYVYTADDERVLALKSDGTRENWTLRDLGNRILRRDDWVPPGGSQQGTGISTTCPGTIAIYCQDFESGDYLGWSQIVSGAIGGVTDYVWRGDKLFAANSADGGVQQFALDHLGTIRLITGDLGTVVSQHAYFPFGEEATTPSQNAQPMKFTGHERDLQTTTANPADDLDYMHARFHSPIVGRMLSVDPALQVSRSIGTPQLWDRYSYALGNPTKYVDPTGRVIDERSNGDDCSGLICRIKEWISSRFDDAFPTPETSTNSAAQALADDGELQQSQVGEFDQGGAAAGAQEGLNSFASIAGAGIVTAAVVVGTDRGINVMTKQLGHVVARHTLGGRESAGASLFGAGENVVSLVKAAGGVQPTAGSRGRLVFIVDAGRTIGYDRNYTMGPTPFYTVITDASRNLITAFPGRP